MEPNAKFTMENFQPNKSNNSRSFQRKMMNKIFKLLNEIVNIQSFIFIRKTIRSTL